MRRTSLWRRNWKQKANPRKLSHFSHSLDLFFFSRSVLSLLMRSGFTVAIKVSSVLKLWHIDLGVPWMGGPPRKNGHCWRCTITDCLHSLILLMNVKHTQTMLMWHLVKRPESFDVNTWIETNSKYVNKGLKLLRSNLFSKCHLWMCLRKHQIPNSDMPYSGQAYFDIYQTSIVAVKFQLLFHHFDSFLFQEWVGSGSTTDTSEQLSRGDYFSFICRGFLQLCNRCKHDGSKVCHQFPVQYIFIYLRFALCLYIAG